MMAGLITGHNAQECIRNQCLVDAIFVKLAMFIQVVCDRDTSQR